MSWEDMIKKYAIEDKVVISTLDAYDIYGLISSYMKYHSNVSVNALMEDINAQIEFKSILYGNDIFNNMDENDFMEYLENRYGTDIFHFYPSHIQLYIQMKK